MNDYDATRRRRADYGLDWRFEWQRYVSRRLGGKATVLAVAGALAARASNADGTAYLSSETMAAEIGKAENHTKDARSILVDAGFLIDTGRTRSGCKVWHLAFPAVHLDDAKAVAAEKRLHRRRTDLAGDPNLGSVHSGDPDLGTEQGPESRNTGTRISEDGDPNLGSHTGDGTGKGTGDDVDRRARERDASGPLGAAYGDAPLAEPRTSDEDGDPIGAAVIGFGAADDPQDYDTTEAEPMKCPECDAMSGEQCDVCYWDGRTEAAPAEPHGEAHGASASADLPAPAAALLAALEAHSPLQVSRVREMLEAQGATLARAMAPLEDVGLAYTAVGPKGLAVHLGSRTPAPVAPVGDPGYVVDPDDDYDDPTF